MVVTTFLIKQKLDLWLIGVIGCVYCQFANLETPEKWALGTYVWATVLLYF